MEVMKISSPGKFDETVVDRNDARERMNEQQRKKMQHEFKIYMEQYFKRTLGKSVTTTKINIVEDMLIIRGEGFLTEPEKFIVRTPRGKDAIRSSRMHVVQQHIIDNLPYFEKRLGAKGIHQTYEVEAENDFWMHVIVFDRVLTD
ncbi:MAG: DUF2294 domain-containing protein [Thermacetogeniaceae bacterium]|jgi:uncharacterized protein YbcI